MADVINRSTLLFVARVNTPDYPEPTWKHNPDMTGVAGVPSRYWNPPVDWDAVGAGPVEMTQPEKDAVDAALLEDQRETVASRVDDVEDELRASLLTILDEFNGQVETRINAILNASDNANNLSQFQAAMAAITDYPTRTIGQFRTAIRNKLGS